MNNKLYEKIKNFIKENLWFFITLISIILIFQVELPYSIETPGGYISLDKRIKIENDDDSSNGELGMAYVSMIKGSIPFLLYSYLNPNWDIIKKEDLTYENESLEDSMKRDKLYFNEAMSNATYVAYIKANKSVTITDYKLYVAYVDNSDSPLKIGDQILELQGVKIDSFDTISNIMNDISSDEVSIKVLRDNTEKDFVVPLKEENGRKFIGIVLIANYNLDTDPKISIISKANDLGPSGGLMTSLGIYQKLTHEDLTKGDKIIGTGTISQNGSVGAIGGVKYKLIGAVNSKAKVFICPKDNYDEAKRIADEKGYDIEIHGVESIDEAISYLRER